MKMGRKYNASQHASDKCQSQQNTTVSSSRYLSLG